ncbi:MAG: hypothetical protein CM15mP18_4790 [Methanobacteriota archaeon]|nr:MAG: hypothetical protein CM15mP18_4790 [Euryarchaeota archaeon]
MHLHRGHLETGSCGDPMDRGCSRSGGALGQTPVWGGHARGVRLLASNGGGSWGLAPRLTIRSEAAALRACSAVGFPVLRQRKQALAGRAACCWDRQEQAPLVPRPVPRNVKKAVMSPDLFILAPPLIPWPRPMKEWTGRGALFPTRHQAFFGGASSGPTC